VDRTLALWRCAAAEGLAAFALVFAGCGAIVADTVSDDALGAVGIGLVFGLVIMAVATDTRAVGAGAAIGAAVGLDALFVGPVTGASMNPARAFGPALATGQWSDFWVYLAGPLIGASAGALAYQLVRGVPVLTPTRGT
jgi:aquaporin NIP